MAKIKTFYWKKCVTIFAGVVVFFTVYALILPALTMSKTEQVLSCHVDVHEHNEECYDEDGYLICGKENYVVHVHEAGCFDESGMLICDLPQISEHVHSDECYSESRVLICGCETEQLHTEECYEGLLSCETEEHVHTEECLDEDGYLVCEKEEHEHCEECNHELILSCEMTEHVHSEECCESVRELICGHQEINLHSHSEDCYDSEGYLVCGQLEVRAHQHGNGCFETVKITEDAKEESLEISEEGTVEVKITEVPAEQETTDGSESEPDETEADAVKEEEVSNITDSSLPAAEMISEEEAIAEKETNTAQNTAQKIVTRTYTGRDFAVTVQNGEEANIPLNSTLCVNEVMPGTEEYAYYYAQVSDSVYGNGDQQVVFARFFDICFMADGQEIEPQAPVDVIIAYQNRVEFPEGDQGVVHFDNAGSIQSVDLGNVAESAAEEVFIKSCYSEENAFTFEADSFSVWGTTIVRTYKSGSTKAFCALRKVTSSLSDGMILYTMSITPDHDGDVFEISTRSNAEPGNAIPIVGADGIDGISLSSPELRITKNGAEINAAEINGKLYCQLNDESFVRVAYLSVENENLISFDENKEKLDGILYLVHDAELQTIDLGIKNISVVVDTEELAKGKSQGESIIWFDVIGTKGEDGYIQDAYTISFKGTEGDVFRLSDYFAGEEFYYGKWTEHVDQNDTEYTENPSYNDDRTFSHGLEIVSFIKIVNNNGEYEMRPCDRNGNLLWNDLSTRITLYSVTDTLYQFAFTVNTMVKEHGEDDGHAYFWNGTDFILGSSSSGTVHSLDDTTFRYNNKSFNFSDYDNGSTAINQITYYLTGRIGESLIASEASDTKIRPGDQPTNPMTAILYAASGSQTTAVNATEWDASWRGAHDVQNISKESYPGWHTRWADMGAHNSDQNGWRRYNYFIRDYLVLDSSWDKAMNFIVSEGENGIPVLSVQKYDDALLYPLIDPYTSIHNPHSGMRQDSGNALYGYNQNGSEGKQAIQLIYARAGIIARRIYQADGTAPEMNHIQLRVDSNVVIEMDGIKYEGSFLYMSGKVSPYAYENGRWESMVNGDNSFVYNLSRRKWSTLEIANSQESGRIEIDPKYSRDSQSGYSHLWDSQRLNISIEYHLAGVLKPLMPDGQPDPDESHWILYADQIPTISNYMNGGKVDPIAENVIETILKAQKGGARRSGEFVYSIVLDDDQLEQATYACPNTEGYDVILDVNAAFSKSFELQEKIIMVKYWDDLGYEAFRPDSVTAVLQRTVKGTDQWTDLQEVAFTGVKNEMQWVASYTLKADESTGSWDYRIKPGSERYGWNETHVNDLHLRYEATYDGLNLTNNVVMPKVDVEGYKVWKNSDGSMMKKEEIPESITLNLYQSKEAGELGVLYDSRTVTEGAEGKWFWTFDQMDKYFVGEDGKLKEYIYTVAEVKATDRDGYEVLHEYNGDVLGGQFVNGELVLIETNQIVEGDGNSFIFINQRKPVISFRKVDPNGSALAGAEFVFTSTSGNVSITFVSDKNGYLIRQDKTEPSRSVELDRDTDYLLTETKAPVGYTKLTEPIHIRYDTRTQRWICTYKNVTLTLIKVDEEHGDLVMLDIENQGVRLPETGGSGVRSITIAGIILIAFSLFSLGWLSRKKKRCE